MSKLEINIVSYPVNYKEIIYQAGINCYGLEVPKHNSNYVAETELNSFIVKIIKNNHDSVLEHVNISIFIKNCTRSFMSQLTRHRLASYSIKSQHYVFHKDFLYDLPINAKTTELMTQIQLLYNELINTGIKKEIARDILPNCCLTNIFMTTNVREYRNIIIQRITHDNTEYMSQFAKQLLRELYLKLPELFFDIVNTYEVE